MNRAAFLSHVQANMLHIADCIADTSRLARFVQGEALAAMTAEAHAHAATIRAEYGAENWLAVELENWERQAIARRARENRALAVAA